MMSHHVTCHVTVVSHASSLSKRKIQEKRKENQYKIRKIKEKKNKIVSIQVSHNIVFDCRTKLVEKRQNNIIITLNFSKSFS